MQEIKRILGSFNATIILFIILFVAAAIATFIENDYGTQTASVMVYGSHWYEVILVALNINLILIILKYKMYKHKARFIFHISFVVMLIGSSLTRYAGYEGSMSIKEGEATNKVITFKPYLKISIKDGNVRYYKDCQMEFSALGNNYFEKDISFGDKVVTISFNKYKFKKTGKNIESSLVVNLSFNGKTKKGIELIGQAGVVGLKKNIVIDNVEFSLGYGSKYFMIPFAIKLNDFILDRYPGSMAPSSYSSKVTLIDKKTKFDYKIFMNHTLDYGGYKFFQS